MAQPKRIRIGDLLVEHKLISEKQLTEALDQQKKSGRKLGRVLVENGYIREEDLLNLLSEQLQVPFVDLLSFDFQPDMGKVIPETIARRYRAIPLEETVDGLLVGMADPTNIFAYDELSRILKRPFNMAVVKESDLLMAIDRLYQHDEAMQNLATELGEEITENVFDLGTLERSTTKSDAPVVRLLETVFIDAINANASDIHIEPDEDVLRIRKRVDGVLMEQVMDQKKISAALVSRLKLMGGLDISEKRLPQDGRFNLKVQDKSIDIRLSTMPTQCGEAVVMRLLDQTGGVLRLHQLGLEDKLLENIRRTIHRPHGLVLVTGPTGSGKTTTLYAMLNELNKPERKIITVEDPVEYSLPRINQVQVSQKIGLDFARVLRTALRQDPDIILVGEIRDAETAEIALRASITGHLVLSTLHTNDVISTATRLIDMGMEEYLVATALHAIVSQRLVRRICESCAEDYQASERELAWLESNLPNPARDLHLRKGKGCQRCNKTGYHGRLAVHEFLELDDELAESLRTREFARFEQLVKNQPGYQNLVANAMTKVSAGHTTLDEVIRISGWID